MLEGGIELVPLCVGLFGFAEVMKNIGTAGRPSTKSVMPAIGRLWPPMKELLGQWKTMLRGSFIGASVGAIPAAGSAIAVAIAYAQEMRFSKRPDEFGKGVTEGVVAPESANSSSIGGTLIPMMTLGIPGDAITAVLMGSLLIHGLRPGPGLFANNPEFVSGVYSSFFLALILTLVIGLLLMRWVAWVTRIPSHILLVVIAVLCVVGSFAIRNTMSDVYIMLAFGLIGYLLNLFRLPAAPGVRADSRPLAGRKSAAQPDPGPRILGHLHQQPDCSDAVADVPGCHPPTPGGALVRASARRPAPHLRAALAFVVGAPLIFARRCSRPPARRGSDFPW